MAVFPSLHSIQDKAVAKKITAAIRKYMPPLLRKESKDKLTSRSLRQGAITELSIHSAITLFQVCARSGHSTGTSLDSYIDKRNVAKILPTANALHQQHNIFAKVVLPQLESLVADIFPPIGSLMTAMYTVSIPEFQPGNRLYPILKICMVSIIMHHIDFERDCLPQKRVSSMLRNAAARAKISDPRVPQKLGLQEVLNYWSKQIKADFQNQLEVSKIESVANETGNQQQLCNMLVDLAKEVGESRKEISEMRTSFNDVVLENASHKATISTMGSEMNDMKHRLQIAERKVSQLRTPPPPQKRSSPVMSSPHLQHASSPPFLPLIDVPAKKAPAPLKLQLQYTFELAVVAEHQGKNKGKRLAMLLVDMARHKCIHPNQISKSSIPPAWNKNKSYLVNCLE